MGGRDTGNRGLARGFPASSAESGVNALKSRDFRRMESVWIPYGFDMDAARRRNGLMRRAVGPEPGARDIA
jgi:hypothetical protein